MIIKLCAMLSLYVLASLCSEKLKFQRGCETSESTTPAWPCLCLFYNDRTGRVGREELSSILRPVRH